VERGEPGKKNPRSKAKTSYKLQAGIEPGPPWWEASTPHHTLIPSIVSPLSAGDDVGSEDTVPAPKSTV